MLDSGLCAKLGSVLSKDLAQKENEDDAKQRGSGQAEVRTETKSKTSKKAAKKEFFAELSDKCDGTPWLLQELNKALQAAGDSLMGHIGIASVSVPSVLEAVAKFCVDTRLSQEQDEKTQLRARTSFREQAKREADQARIAIAERDELRDLENRLPILKQQIVEAEDRLQAELSLPAEIRSNKRITRFNGMLPEMRQKLASRELRLQALRNKYPTNGMGSLQFNIGPQRRGAVLNHGCAAVSGRARVSRIDRARRVEPTHEAMGSGVTAPNCSLGVDVCARVSTVFQT